MLPPARPIRTRQRHGQPRSLVEHAAQAFWRHPQLLYAIIVTLFSLSIELGVR